MSKQLNTQPVDVVASAGVVDLISGAYLSGLAGAASPSPRVRAKSVSAVFATSGVLTLYKGASGGAVPSTILFRGFAPTTPVEVIPLNIVLEAGEVLTALVNSGTPTDHVTCTIDAEITF